MTQEDNQTHIEQKDTPSPVPASTDPGLALMFTNWEYIEVLKRQLPFVIVFTLSAIFTSLALTYVASEKFEAATTIFYRPVEVTRLKTQDAQAFGSPVPAAAFEVIGKTIEEVLHSYNILEKVVARLHLDEKVIEDYSGEPWYIRYYEEAKDWILDQGDIIWAYMKYGRLIEEDKKQSAINKLNENIDIEIDDSYISYIKVIDKNNIRAAAIVDALAEEMVEWLQDKERVPLTYKKQRLLDALTEKQAEIDTYRDATLSLLSENAVSSISEELEQGNIRLSNLEISRINILAEIANFTKQLKEVQNKLKQQGSEKASEGVRIQADDFKRLTSEEIDISINLEGARAKYAASIEEIGKLKNRLSLLTEVDNKYQRIQANLSTVTRDHVLTNDAFQEVIVREHSIYSEIGVLHKAVVPMEPVTPIKIYHVSLAAALGLLTSVGLVYLLNFFNIRILFSSKGVKGRKQAVNVECQTAG